jgi:uncharacterized protein (DUF433 family)
MTFSEPAIVTVPLRRDEDGNLRIGQTRILLEIVIHQFQAGATPEDIVRGYSSLTLNDVYAVIAYYLQNKAEVDEYMRQQEVEAAEIRAKIEAIQPDMPEFIERLRKRMAEKEQKPQ